MREDRLDHVLRIALLAQDRRPVLRMLVERRMDLPVEVVQQGDDAPDVLVLAEAPRVGADRGLDGERVAAQPLTLCVARERVPGRALGLFHRSR